MSDDDGVSTGLKMRLGLASDIAVVGESLSLSAARLLAKSLCPDIVLLDVHSAEAGAIEISAALEEMSIAVIVLGFFEDHWTARPSTMKHRRPIVSKLHPITELLATIRRVHALKA